MNTDLRVLLAMLDNIKAVSYSCRGYTDGTSTLTLHDTGKAVEFNFDESETLERVDIIEHCGRMKL